MSRPNALKRAGLLAGLALLVFTSVASAQPITHRFDGNVLVTGQLTVLGGSAATGGVALPENSVGADELATPVDSIVLCGENAENGAIFFGPATAPFLGDGTAHESGSTVCDALDSATETTADAPIHAGFPAFKVLGFWCTTDATLGAAETIVFALRSAAAATTPALTCTISEAGTACSELDSSTTDIATGATIAMSVTSTSNNADGDESWCRLYIAPK